MPVYQSPESLFGTTIGDLMQSLRSDGPSSLFRPDEIKSREDAARQLMMAKMISDSGLTPSANLSGGFSRKSAQSQPTSRGSGASITKGSNLDIPRVAAARTSQNSQYQDRMNRERDFKDQLRRDAQSKMQDQKMKMQFLNEIFKKFGGMGNNRETVTTEQIFNNAGAPMKVPLKTVRQGDNNEMLMQLLRGIL